MIRKKILNFHVFWIAKHDCTDIVLLPLQRPQKLHWSKQDQIRKFGPGDHQWVLLSKPSTLEEILFELFCSKFNFASNDVHFVQNLRNAESFFRHLRVC